jgi:outer membrane protein assembly factor BamB/Icc-related predicted phosphoesterase
MKRQLVIFIALSVILLNASCNTDEKPLRIVILTDLHVSPESESHNHLLWVIDDINRQQPDMVIITGDMTNTGSDAELQNIKEMLKQLIVPYRVLPGNHETNWSESAGETFLNLWGDDKFAFQLGEYFFIGINTGPFMRMGDGHIKTQDLNWLHHHFESHVKKNRKVLFFAHYPIAEGLDRWREVSELLHQYPVISTFCGHGHQSKLIDAGGIPGIMNRSMVYRGDTVAGYNIVEIKNDSLFVFEKTQLLSEPEFRFVVAGKQTSGELPSPADFSVNRVFSNISPVWHRQEENSMFAGPLIVGDSLIVTACSEGKVKATQISTSTIIWVFDAGGPVYATPALTEQETIIVATTKGAVYSLGLKGGKLNWTKQFGNVVVATPLVDGDAFYIGIGKQGMCKLKVTDGEEIWNFKDVNGLIQSEPALKDGKLVFSAWDTHLYCLDSQTGNLLWKWNNGRTGILLSPGNVVPVISRGKVFIVAPDRYMTCLDLNTGNEIWRTNRHQVRESIGISADGSTVYAKLMNDSVMAVETAASHFQTRWIADAGFGYDHNPIPIKAHEGIIYTATRNGLIMALDETAGKILWKHKISNTAVNFFSTGTDAHLWFTSTCGQVVGLPYK